MLTSPAQLIDVSYNASTQCFEAVVKIHGKNRTRGYACAIKAPITMAFKDAAESLARQAMRQHQKRKGLSSSFARRAHAQRSGRTKFDLDNWLEQLASLPGKRAA